jgi:hypothetical protein
MFLSHQKPNTVRGKSLSCAGRPDVQGKFPPDPVDHEVRGEPASVAVAASPGSDRGIRPSDRTPSEKRARARMAPGRPDPQGGLDSRRPGKVGQGDRSAAFGGRNRDRPSADREARPARFHIQGSPGPAGQYESVAYGAEKSGNQGLQVARSSAHVGLVAHSGGNSDPRASGTRRMGKFRNGPPVRTSVSGPSGPLCRQGRVRHKHGTAGFEVDEINAVSA